MSSKLGIISQTLKHHSESGFILDDYPGAHVAYSLRALSSSFTGNVIQVERGGDSAINAFTATEVTDGTLVSWANEGNGDAYVIVWYDQTGNNRNLNCFSLGNTIVSGGTLLTEDGTPYILFPDWVVITDYALNPVYSLSSTSATMFMVMKVESGETRGRLFGNSNSSFYVGEYLAANSSFLISGNAGTPDFYINGINVGDSSELTRGGLSFELGNSFRQISVTSMNVTNSTWDSGNVPFVGPTSITNGRHRAKEFIFYDSNQNSNRASIESNMQTHYSI
jgi:hypothetical protein